MGFNSGFKGLIANSLEGYADFQRLAD